MTSPYQREQTETLNTVCEVIRGLKASERKRLKEVCADYLQFRDHVDRFLYRHFSDICTERCYEGRRSACCSREGIITFFADMVINVLISEDAAVENLITVLEGDGRQGKCIYLGDHGCLWRVKPIVCEMFLCDRAMDMVFGSRSELKDRWEELEQERKCFTWPDRPVLFDDLERYFMDRGCTSPLMYLHNSPGLLRVKQAANTFSP